MSRVPHLLLVRNKCYYVLGTVPSVSIYYHKYIIYSVHLLDNPFLMVKTYSSAWFLSKSSGVFRVWTGNGVLTKEGIR